MGSEAAALIGMGLCAAGFFGAALGIAYIFAKTIETVGRQPNCEARVAKYCWIGFALVEAIALYASGYCLYHYAVKEAESLRWQIAMALFCGQIFAAIAHWPHAEWLGASFLLDEL